MVDWFWYVPALGVFALVLAVFVSVRVRLVHDLTIIEKMRALGLDESGKREAHVRASFDTWLRLSYGWFVAVPKALRWIGGAALLLGGMSLVLGWIEGDAKWAAQGVILGGLGGVAYLLANGLRADPAHDLWAAFVRGDEEE